MVNPALSVGLQTEAQHHPLGEKDPEPVQTQPFSYKRKQTHSPAFLYMLLHPTEDVDGESLCVKYKAFSEQQQPELANLRKWVELIETHKKVETENI